MKQYAAVGDIVYFWFGSNDTSGSGDDGASPAADVRLAGAAADAIPVYSPTPVLLIHANYPAGAYEVAIAATAENGFATNNTYAVFCTLTVNSQNPTGFVGSFDLKPVQADISDAAVDKILDEIIGDAIHATPNSVGAMLHGVYCRFMQKRTATIAAEVAYKLDDTTPLKTFTLTDDDVTVTRV